MAGGEAALFRPGAATHPSSYADIPRNVDEIGTSQYSQPAQILKCEENGLACFTLISTVINLSEHTEYIQEYLSDGQ